LIFPLLSASVGLIEANEWEATGPELESNGNQQRARNFQGTAIALNSKLYALPQKEEVHILFC